jgi:hypothetical protein
MREHGKRSETLTKMLRTLLDDDCEEREYRQVMRKFIAGQGLDYKTDVRAVLGQDDRPEIIQENLKLKQALPPTWVSLVWVWCRKFPIRGNRTRKPLAKFLRRPTERRLLAKQRQARTDGEPCLSASPSAYSSYISVSGHSGCDRSTIVWRTGAAAQARRPGQYLQGSHMFALCVV